MKLIDNWHRAHRMLSVQLTTLNASLVYGWHQMPDDWKAFIPQSLMVKAAIGLFVLTIIARLIDQGDTTQPKDHPQ